MIMGLNEDVLTDPYVISNVDAAGVVDFNAVIQFDVVAER